MVSVTMGLVAAGASAAVVVWGAALRRSMERHGMLHGAGLMPAGAAQEAG